MFCPNCGKEIQQEALFCGNCGFSVKDFKIDNNVSEEKQEAPEQPTIEFTTAQTAPVQEPAPVIQNVQPAVQQPVAQPATTYSQNDQFQAIDDNNTLKTVIKVFLILGCVAQGWMIIPLAWCIPMTVVLFKKMNNRQPIGMGLKICTLLFVSLVSGICLLCLKDERK